MVAEQAQPELHPQASQLEERSDSDPRWWRRVGFWRAVAGMAVALALATSIVLVEFSELLTHRTVHYAHRVAALNAAVQDLKRRVISVERRNANVIERDSADEVLKRVVAASDLRTIKLAGPPAAKPPGKNDGTAQSASGTLAISSHQAAAVLQVVGLETGAQGTIYRVWWQEKRPTLATEFRPAADGKATVPMQLPPRSASMVLITCEAGTNGATPSGPVVLKGRISP